MDCAKTGALILKLRRELGLTQKELAERMNISDKAVSKWERGLGCPDVSLLPELSEIFGVGVESLLKGALTAADLNGGNMKRTKFYVCPCCGAVLTANGEAEASCCGRRLVPLKASEIPEELSFSCQTADDEWYITLDHPMTKTEYVSFAAYVSYDRMLMVRLYPEQECAVRLPIMHGGALFLYSTKYGLLRKAI